MAWHTAFIFCVILSATVLAEDAKQINEMQAIAIEERDLKKAIKIQQDKIDQAEEIDKAQYTEELALLYLKDQDQEKAFAAFLKVLDLIAFAAGQETVSAETIFVNDEVEYKRAFSIYLDPASESPTATAINLIKALLPVIKAKPDQYLLDYFVAIAYANLGKYEEFFTHFYRAYRFYPAHYLAFKTKAVMHIKLLERTRLESGRAEQRQAIMDNLTLALEREPQDITIYKLLISFSPKEKKRDQVQLCLNKIINGNIMIPRSELMFYVIEAVDVSDHELAQRFIDRAKVWYPQSRIVTSAQNYLDP